MRKLFTVLLLFISLISYSQNTEYKIIDYDNLDRPFVEFVEYNQDGLLVQKGQYIGQEPHGIWKMYNQNGEIISTMLFSFGERIWMKTIINGRETTIYYQENQPYKLIALLK